MFRDRIDAGQRLAAALNDLRHQPLPLVVLAIPRGGVLVACEVARALHAAIDVCLTHKIGAPGNPELAIGAVADDGATLFDQFMLEEMGVSLAHVEHEVAHWQKELARRAAAYRGDRPRVPVKDCVAIVVDDGVATGSTLSAALRSTRAAGAHSVIAAVPVGPAATIRRLSQEADRVVCLSTPYDFWAVGQFYRSFEQVSDEEVVAALQALRDPGTK